MFSIWKNEILNSLEIWRIPQDLQKGPANTLTSLSQNVNNVNINLNR